MPFFERPSGPTRHIFKYGPSRYLLLRSAGFAVDAGGCSADVQDVAEVGAEDALCHAVGRDRA